MKTRFTFLILTVALVTLLASCKKEEPVMQSPVLNTTWVRTYFDPDLPNPIKAYLEFDETTVRYWTSFYDRSKMQAESRYFYGTYAFNFVDLNYRNTKLIKGEVHGDLMTIWYKETDSEELEKWTFTKLKS